MTAKADPTPKLELRWLTRRDVPAAAAASAATPDPWTEADFEAAMKPRNRIGVAAVRGGVVVGYVVYELHDWHVRVVALAVHAGHRRRGVGAALVRKVVARLGPHRRRAVVLDAPDDRLPLHLLLRREGFTATRVVGACYRFERHAARDKAAA